jgi:membrane protease YdiL (CAAX protease family)
MQPNLPHGPEDSQPATAGGDSNSGPEVAGSQRSVDPSSVNPTSQGWSGSAPTPQAGVAVAGDFSHSTALLSQCISWAVVAFCTLFFMGSVFLSQFQADPNSEDAKPVLVDADMAGQFGLGIEQMFGSGGAQVLDGLNEGPVHRRLVRIVLLAELFKQGSKSKSVDKAEGESDRDESENTATGSEGDTSSSTPAEQGSAIQDSGDDEHVGGEASVDQDGVTAGNDSQEAGPEASSSSSGKSIPAKPGLNDPLEALAELRAAIEDANYEPTQREAELIDDVERAVAAKLAGTPLAADSDTLNKIREELSFAGRVAAAWSADDATEISRLRTASGYKLIVSLLFAAGIALAVILGLCVAALLIYFLVTGSLRSGLTPPDRHGYLYLEAFAVWMGGFLLMQFVLAFVMFAMGMGEEGAGGGAVVLNLLLFYGPWAVALGWLGFRHPSPREAFRQAGFTTRSLASDFGVAVTTHLAFLPLLGAAMFLTVVLTGLTNADSSAANPFAPPTTPSHPIQEQFDGQWSTVLLLFFLAAVTAPIVEETVFRGLLYRYLRDWTSRQSLVFSIVLATIVNSFIFASIHPQGLLGIPPLMTLAAAMSVSREWSGGLWAPMVIHAVNNGVLVCFMSVMFS